MQLVSLLATISTLIFQSGSASQYSENYPICIVGGGLSGLTVGRELHKKRYENVMVFEKSHKVGGKLDTYREGDDIQVEMGAMLHNPSYHSFMEYMREFNLTSVKYPLYDLVGFDPQSGIFRQPRIDLVEATKTGLAAARYHFYHSLYARDIKFGYENASPDLFVSFSDWLDKRGLGALKLFLIFPFTNMGYGDLSDIPALYGLKYFDTDLLVSSSPFPGRHGVFTVAEGLDTFANKMASTLNVFLNKEVVRIQRHSDHQEIFFNDNEFPIDNVKVVGSQKCLKVILAFAPLLTRLDKILELSEYERETLKHVKINKYSSAVNYIPTLKTGTMFIETLQQDNPKDIPRIVYPAGNGEVVLMGRQSPKKRKQIFSSYSWIRGDFAEPITEFEEYWIKSRLEDFLAKTSKDSKTLCWTTTDYFPHVDGNSLRQGFYKNFSRIQGQGGVYYATPLLTFEIMEHTIRGAKELVKQYF